jgi:transposase
MKKSLYAVERQAGQDNLTAEQIKELRLKESLPTVNEMGKWIFQKIKAPLQKAR